MTRVRQRIRGFILREYLPHVEPQELTDSVELIDSGILNSIARIRLRAYLEDEFDIVLAGHELDFEHFGTVVAIAALVRSKIDDPAAR